MKKCPFCAEAIQDAAIVCKHCGKDLPPQVKARVQPSRRNRLIQWSINGSIAVVILFALIGFFGQPIHKLTNDKEPLLEITAARGVAGISFTNKEGETLQRCDVAALDEGKEWMAVVPGSVLRSQTVSVQWSDFKSNDQPMPGFIGRNRNNFIISCFLDSVQKRRSAGVHF